MVGGEAGGWRFCQSAFSSRAGGHPPEDQKAETTSRRLFAAASACRSCGQRAKRHVSAKAETRAGGGIEAGVLPDGKTEAESAWGRAPVARRGCAVAAGRVGRRGAGAPSRGERPERRVPEAERSTLRDRQRREVSRNLDTDGLPLVVRSSGVQEGRPFFFSVHSGPSLPRFGELDAQTRREISATGDATR